MADKKKENKEQFVGPYKIKKIISINAMELKLPESIKIHLFVNPTPNVATTI